jgi:N-acetylmuramoyl-L-alanine amidase
MIPIDFHAYRSVKGFNSRISMLVFHYTVLNFVESIEALTGPLASAHYLIPDPKESSYIATGLQDMRIFNLVDEKDRAWHTGASAWRDRTTLNDCSIGIEIVNGADETHRIFPPFASQQIKAIKELVFNILQRHPDITPTNIVGHADIAPGSKLDPGPQFPWYELYQAGIGAWYDEHTKTKYAKQYMHKPLPADRALALFHRYGYDTKAAARHPLAFKQLIRAFQLHFRPQNYDGALDVETTAILAALVEKYT